MWDCKRRSSEMLLMINSCVQFCGRGSDLACASLSDVYAEVNKTRYGQHYRLGQNIFRAKTCARTGVSIRKHAVYPQRDKGEFMLCYYFSLGYHLLLSEESIINNDKLFPSFFEKMRGNCGNSTEPKVSEHFNNLMDLFFNIMYDFFNKQREMYVYTLFLSFLLNLSLF